MNNKNSVQKAYKRKEQTYNCVMYFIRLEFDIKIKELTKPENFKSLKQIK